MIDEVFRFLLFGFRTGSDLCVCLFVRVVPIDTDALMPVSYTHLIDVARLKVLKADHQSQQYRMEDKLLKYFPAEIEKQTGYIDVYKRQWCCRLRSAGA